MIASRLLCALTACCGQLSPSLTKLMSRSAVIAALLASTAPAQIDVHSRKLPNGNIEIKIKDSAGIARFKVIKEFEQAAVELNWVNSGGCPTEVTLELISTPANPHNHSHSVLWQQCSGGVLAYWTVHGLQYVRGTPLPVASPFGAGCGSSGALALAMDAPPELGTAPSLVVTNISGYTPALGFLLSPGGVTSPVALSSLGYQAPGCSIYVDLATTVMFAAIAPTSNVAQYPFPLPGSPALQGITFYLQVLGASPEENPSGIVTSNGLLVQLALAS
jgi:hypothetical protein